MSESNSAGYFTLVGSNIIKNNGIYKVSIYSHNYKKEEKIEVGIESSDEEYTNKKVVTLLGTNNQNVDFELNKLPEDNYKISVRSLTGEDFETERGLHMNTKKYIVLVQTDKSVYKPSDTVKFRILILDADTRPFHFNTCEIFITDGADNRVKQFENPASKFTKGVYVDEFQLSDLPVMGVWKINVKINGEEAATKSFDVEEYVLPKFSLSIDTNPDIVYKKHSINAKVKATYTFGKIAKGTATVTAKVDQSYSRWNVEDTKSKKIVKTVEVDGKNTVNFNMKEIGLTKTNSKQTVTLTASFKDDLSGKEATATAEVTVHPTPVTMKLIKGSEKFKPGLPFQVMAVLSSIEKNVPFLDDKNPVKFSVTIYYDVLRKVNTATEENVSGRRLYPGEGYEYWEERSKSEEHKVYAVNGIAKLNLNLGIDTTQFTVKAKYINIEKDIYRVQKVDSLCRQYIQAKLLNEKPSVSENIKVEILATNDINKLTYQVVGSGQILEAKHLTFTAGKSQIFEIKPTVSMLPKCQIVVHYIAENGEIISDKLDVKFGAELMNHIKLQLSAEQAKPGEDLAISVETKPNSFVGLLGVDQSVLLLKKGNDIEPEVVFEELGKFGEVDKYNSLSNSSGNHPGDFQNMVLITNAKMASETRIRSYELYERSERHSCKMSYAPQRMMSMAMNADVEMFDEVETMSKPVQIRSKFPETWLFDSLEFDKSGSAKILTKEVPDTITSWIITGFSLDPLTGLGLTTQPSKLTVFQPFFVSTNLPYSIKRGEVVSIPVIIFNYLESDQLTVVTLFNTDDEFEFEDADEKCGGKSDKIRKKQISLKSDEGATVSFTIRPLKIGSITIKVIAESPMAGDGVERQLKVEPEGVTQFLNEALLIDLRTEKEFRRTIEISVPAEAVPDSTRVEVSAIGDILGPSIENLDKLIKLPYGCGEQNMLNFVPNIVILDYLTSLNKLTPAIEEKAKKYMEKGYQRELTYKHCDGSYSAFGSYDKNGSTWLTAFVAKSFHQASKYIKIDQNNILQALNFLKSTQIEDGSFPENGYICHRDMQGGSSKGIALTAYVLIAFLENEKLAKRFEEVIRKAQNYILKNLSSLKDIYSLALANYALQLSGHDEKEALLKELISKSINKDGMKHWEKDVPKMENSWHRPNSVNVEMSAYALQAFILADRDSEAIPIMKWLVTQRNKNGGFQSTQDTVVGLQALSKLASKVQVTNSDLKISVKSAKRSAEITVNDENSLVLQKHEIPADSRHFDVLATGRGFSIFQISYRFNLDNSGKFPRFSLEPTVDSSSNNKVLLLNVSTSFIPDALVTQSNMAVMEVALPSGFTYDSDHMEELLAIEKVKKVETKDGETIVMIYFDDILDTKTSIQVKAYRTHAVAELKPAPIIIYDYYDNSRCARTFYSIPEIGISDIAAA